MATCTFIGALIVSAPTFSATVVFNDTLDISKPSVYPFPDRGWGGTSFLGSYNNLQVSEGDTYEFNIDFLGAQTLTINNLNSVLAISFSELNVDATMTGSISFLDALGQPFLTSNLKTSTEFKHIGQGFEESDFATGIPANITFSGIHYSGVVDDFSQTGVTTGTYWSSAFGVTVSAVPEPESYAMLLAGLGLIGFMAHRRKQAI